MTSKVVGLELYRRGVWRYSIREEPEAIGCGRLSTLPPEAPFAEAETELLALVQHGYGVTLRPAWRQTEDDWWVADIKD